MVLGELLRSARKARGLSAAEVCVLLAAEDVRLHHQTLYALEKGSHNVGHRYMDPLIKVLRLDSAEAWAAFKAQPSRRKSGERASA